MDYKDYYQLLEVDKKASKEDISKAFKRLARKYHPDLNPGDASAETKFKELNEAYEVLKDPEKRKLYDSLGPNWKDGQNFQPPPGYENMGQHFRGGAGGYDAGGFSDFFETIFGGAGGARFSGGGFGGGGFGGGGYGGAHMRRGEDVTATLELSLPEAYKGGSKTITLNVQEQGADGRMSVRPKTLNVNIPAGVREGSKIRLSGQGQAGYGGSAAGDLYLSIRIAEHPQFKLEENDVTVDVPLSPWEAALGAKVRVPTLDGAVELNIPAGVSSGRKFRLRGKGLGQGAAKGDQYARIMIQVPATLSEQEKELFTKLSEISGFAPREG